MPTLAGACAGCPLPTLGNSTLGFRSLGASLALTALSPVACLRVVMHHMRTIRARVKTLS
eukprot:7831699-Alexandrium_andersonii.AAC.1